MNDLLTFPMYIGEGTEVDVIDVFSPESEDDTSETLLPARTVMTTGPHPLMSHLSSFFNYYVYILICVCWVERVQYHCGHVISCIIILDNIRC